MKIQFLGATREVTGSKHLITTDSGHTILLDCGMYQGKGMETDAANRDLGFDPATLDCVVLSHAHIDHSGLIPYIVKMGFKGDIYCTPATRDLCALMLTDTAFIQEQDVRMYNKKIDRQHPHKEKGKKYFVEPLYNQNDVNRAMKHFVTYSYDRRFRLFDDVLLTFTNSGHMLGGAICSLEVYEAENSEVRSQNSDQKRWKRITYTGDIGRAKSHILPSPQLFPQCDYLICESTYGDRLHDFAGNPLNTVTEFAGIIQRTLDRGGTLLIPSFAVGRTQEMLYAIREIKEKGWVRGHDGFKVYVDSPLAVEATGIFHKNEISCFDEEAMELVKKGINPITFQGLNLSITSDESKAINFDMTPKVILSASGMCEAGRIRHHLKHNLWRPESTILFVGYQAIGTLGRAIIDGAKEVRLFGETIEIRADIRKLVGISGHADREGLLEWIGAFKNRPKKVFVVHGEDAVADAFAQTLIDECDLDAYAPYSGTRFDLISGTFDYEASGIPIAPKKKPVSDVFSRLLAAGQRLMGVIKKNEGLANKDLAKFADQINSLSDKWDR